MKRESNTYEVKGQASINTTITSQQEVLADIRSITGVTIVTFTPADQDNPGMVLDNTDYKGVLDIKVDTFPFERFDKSKHIKDIILKIRRIPAVNYFRPNLISLLENETL